MKVLVGMVFRLLWFVVVVIIVIGNLVNVFNISCNRFFLLDVFRVVYMIGWLVGSEFYYVGGFLVGDYRIGLRYLWLVGKL